jgi:hypothetical protein
MFAVSNSEDPTHNDNSGWPHFVAVHNSFLHLIYAPASKGCSLLDGSNNFSISMNIALSKNSKHITTKRSLIHEKI